VAGGRFDDAHAVLAALGEAGLVAGLTRGRRLDPERAVALLID
jgi:hypothetical protein